MIQVYEGGGVDEFREAEQRAVEWIVVCPGSMTYNYLKDGYPDVPNKVEWTNSRAEAMGFRTSEEARAYVARCWRDVAAKSGTNLHERFDIQQRG